MFDDSDSLDSTFQAEDSDSESQQLSMDEQLAFWQPLVTTTSIYCIFIFLIGCTLSSRPGTGYFFAGISLAFSMAQLTAIFAALGPGGYLSRLFVSQICGLMFVLSLFGGIAVSGQPMPRGFLNSIFVVAIVGSASAQFIYGIFRLAHGWRIHLDIHQRGLAYNLKDLFALTLFVAVLLSVMNLDFSGNGPQDGRIRLILSTFVFLSVGTLVFGIPTLATTLRLEKVENGCGIQLMILSAILFVVLLPVLSIGTPMEVAAPVFISVCGISLFTWVPLAILRNRGLVMTRPCDILDR